MGMMTARAGMGSASDLSRTQQNALFNAAEGDELLVFQTYDDHVLDIKDDDGKTLLMVAAEHGHETIVLHLIGLADKREHPEEFLNYCDLKGETALMKAIYHQHEHVVRLLVEREADCNIKDNDGVLPLQRAIRHENEEMGRLLAPKTELDERRVFALVLCELERDGPFGCILLEACFEKVAEEFKHAYVDSSPRTLMVRKGTGMSLVQERSQVSMQNAKRSEKLSSKQVAREMLTPHGKDRILPRRRPISDYLMLRKSTLSRPAVYRARLTGMCHIDIIHAFADVPTSATVLSSDAAEAIVSFLWEDFRILFCIDLFMDMVLLANVIWLASQRRGDRKADQRNLALAAALVCKNFVHEVLQMVSKVLHYVRRHGEGRDSTSPDEEAGGASPWQRACLVLSGFLQYYIVDGNILDWWILPVHLYGLVSASGEEYNRNGMAAWVVICWLNVLFDLNAFAVFGPRILPIIATLKDTVPFLVVTLGFLLAAANAIYILSTREAPEDGLQWIYFPVQLTFRLVMLGDVDWLDVEGTDIAYKEVNGTLEPENPEPTDSFGGAVVWITLTTIVIHVGLMNLFIGILGASYDKYEGQARCLFVQDRASIIVRLDARWGFMRRAWKRFRGHPTPNADDSDQYLWFAVRAQTAFDDDRSLRTVIKKPVEQLLAQQQSIFDFVQEMQKKQGRILKEMQESAFPNEGAVVV